MSNAIGSLLRARRAQQAEAEVPELQLEPLTIRAHLRNPPLLSAGPVYLDALLLAGLGYCLGGMRGEWIDPSEVASYPLPLAKVETDAGWWYAASCARQTGPVRGHHFHRRPPTDVLLQLSSAKSVEIGTGPDKAFRLRAFRSIAVREMTWTCIGDARRIAPLLLRVVGVGAQSRHHGNVVRWEIEEGGPPFAAYSGDLRLRHLPTRWAAPEEGSRLVSLPLRPPYYRTGVDAVDCWQIG